MSVAVERGSGEKVAPAVEEEGELDTLLQQLSDARQVKTLLRVNRHVKIGDA